MKHGMKHDLKCRIWGCELDGEFDRHCKDCGAELYYDFRQGGWLTPIVLAFWNAANRIRRIRRKCAVCGKAMWCSHEYCCSEKCYDKWVPF